MFYERPFWPFYLKSPGQSLYGPKGRFGHFILKRPRTGLKRLKRPFLPFYLKSPGQGFYGPKGRSGHFI